MANLFSKTKLMLLCLCPFRVISLAIERSDHLNTHRFFQIALSLFPFNISLWEMVSIVVDLIGTVLILLISSISFTTTSRASTMKIMSTKWSSAMSTNCISSKSFPLPKILHVYQSLLFWFQLPSSTNVYQHDLSIAIRLQSWLLFFCYPISCLFWRIVSQALPDYPLGTVA